LRFALDDYLLILRTVVPIRVVAIEANRTRLRLSCKNTTPMMTANTMLVSRSADTSAIGASVNAQITNQDEP
jgi:hypothetical protein